MGEDAAGGGPGPALTGVLGSPLAHSRSPAMMAAAFRAAGLSWRYLKLPVPLALLAATVRALPASGYRGANVTMPHKRAALELADDVTPVAVAVGAANTLTFANGAIEADNTDGPGLLDALAGAGAAVAGARALVLGAGGAARAAAWALREGGAAEVAVWNRTPERAAALAGELGLRQVRLPAPADLLVNATPVGSDPAATEQAALEALRLDGLEPPAMVVDLAYGEHDSPVSSWAARGGARVIDGIEVLVRQGARSFALWTGLEAPISAMRTAARR